MASSPRQSGSISPNTAPSTARSTARNSGAAMQAKIDQDKGHREKSRSLGPLVKLWPFIKRYPMRLLGFLIFLILSACATLVIPAILKLIVDCGFGENTSTIAYCKAAGGGADSLDKYFIIAIFFGILFSLFGALRFFFITTLGQRVIADIRRAVFDKLNIIPCLF